MAVSLNIFILEEDGTKYDVTCGANGTVLNLKEVISLRRSIPLDRLTLFYLGRVLLDNVRLSGYGIKSQDVINCVRKSETQTKEAEVPLLLSPKRGRPAHESTKPVSESSSSARLPRTKTSVHKPRFLIRRYAKDLGENVTLLAEDEVEESFRFWNEKAALGKFDPDIHIVDPLAHSTYLDYLERDVVQFSEYFRCGGNYDPRDFKYNTDLAEISMHMRIPEMTWSQFHTRLDKLCSPSTKGEGADAQFALREFQKGLPSLRKSYEILCNILVMLDYLRKWHFCTDFYSIFTRGRVQDVAELTPITETLLEELRQAIEDAVVTIINQKVTCDSVARLLVSDIAHVWCKFQDLIQLRKAPTPLDNAADIPELCRMATLVMDLALVSYVGSHASRFDSQYLKTSLGKIKIASQHKDVRNVICSLHRLACLSEFIDGANIWLFDSVDAEPLSSEHTEKELKVLTYMNTFADIWGPVWSVGVDVTDSDVILQYNLPRGCIRRTARSQSTYPDFVECHWYDSPTSIDKQHKEVGPFLRPDDRLLIGEYLQPNDACLYTISHFKSDFELDLSPLGTFPETYRLDTRTLGITAGQYVTVGVSGTQKRQPGVTLKEKIWNQWQNNPNNANIEWLNYFIGLEISHCTGNAKQVRLKDLFCLPMVKERLIRYDARWATTDWGAPFLRALEDADFETMRSVWNDPAKRTDIAKLICQVLELLQHTGQIGEHLVAACFHPGHADEKVELSNMGNEWARCLRDSDKGATYAVITNKCLKYPSTTNAVPNCAKHHRTATVLQTQIMFRSLPQPGVNFIRLIPHRNVLRVESIGTENIVLQADDQLLATLARPVNVATIGMVSLHENRGFKAIVKAAKESYGGTQNPRQDVHLQGQQPNGHLTPHAFLPEQVSQSSQTPFYYDRLNPLPLRIAQAVISVIILGLTAYLNDWPEWHRGSRAPRQAKYMLFCAVWTLIDLIYLIITPEGFTTTALKVGIFAIEVLTMVFWFAAWVALAALLGHAGCNHSWGICRAATAATVFAAFQWLFFLNTVVMASISGLGYS